MVNKIMNVIVITILIIVVIVAGFQVMTFEKREAIKDGTESMKFEFKRHIDEKGWIDSYKILDIIEDDENMSKTALSWIMAYASGGKFSEPLPADKKEQIILKALTSMSMTEVGSFVESLGPVYDPAQFYRINSESIQRNNAAEGVTFYIDQSANNEADLAGEWGNCIGDLTGQGGFERTLRGLGILPTCTGLLEKASNHKARINEKEQGDQ